MRELERLCRNKKLLELDPRLNPISKKELVYRLYLIYAFVSVYKCIIEKNLISTSEWFPLKNVIFLIEILFRLSFNICSIALSPNA